MLLCEPAGLGGGVALLDEIAVLPDRESGVLGWCVPTPTPPAPTPSRREPTGTRKGEPHSPPDSQEPGVADRRDPSEPPARPDTIRILLVDDHVAVREAFAFALGGEAGIEVVGGAGGGLAALDQVRQLRPDVVLMDVNLPGMSGIEATRLLCAEFPRIVVIGLSMYESEELEAAMRSAGARGYVSKSASYTTLLTAIRACRESDPA
jgi:CheY-like chemotaxis protein